MPNQPGKRDIDQELPNSAIDAAGHRLPIDGRTPESAVEAPSTDDEVDEYREALERDDLGAAKREGRGLAPKSSDSSEKESIESELAMLREKIAGFELANNQWEKIKSFVIGILTIILGAATLVFGGNLVGQLMATRAVYAQADRMEAQIKTSENQLALSREQIQSTKHVTESLQYDFDAETKVLQDELLTTKTRIEKDLGNATDNTRRIVGDLSKTLKEQVDLATSQMRGEYATMASRLNATEEKTKLALEGLNARYNKTIVETRAVHESLALLSVGYSELLTGNALEANRYAERVLSQIDAFTAKESADATLVYAKRLRPAAWILQAHCAMQLNNPTMLRQFATHLLDNNCECMEGIRYVALLDLLNAAETNDDQERSESLRNAREGIRKVLPSEPDGNSDLVLVSLTEFHLDHFPEAARSSRLYIDAFPASAKEREVLSRSVQFRLVVATAIRDLAEYATGRRDTLTLPESCDILGSGIPAIEGRIMAYLVEAIPGKLATMARSKKVNLNDTDVKAVKFYCDKVVRDIQIATMMAGRCHNVDNDEETNVIYRRGETAPKAEASPAPAPPAE